MRRQATHSRGHRHRGAFATLLRVQARLTLREPYAVLLGLGLPLVLLWVFGFISGKVSGNVAHSGLSVIDLYIPTLMVIALIAISISLPNTLVRDREIGWLRRVSTTPVSPWRLLGVQMVIDLGLAVIAVVVLLVGGSTIFGAPLHLDVPIFVVSAALAVAEIFSLGLLLVALIPTQALASAVAGVVFFLLLFLSGLWVQPVQVVGPLREVMWYSPSGAAARALLYSVFNHVPPVTTLIALAGYTVVFAYASVRLFRWE